MLNESGRRVFKEWPAGASEGTHLFGTVRLHEQGRRAACGVVSGVRLPLQHHDARMPGQKVSHGGPGGTGPDDYEISIFPGVQYAIPRPAGTRRLSERVARGCYFETSFRRSATLAAVRLEASAPKRAVT